MSSLEVKSSFFGNGCGAADVQAPTHVVRNTFIDFPATPAGGMPQPMASAPAQVAGRCFMKDSLAAAADESDEEAEDSGGQHKDTARKRATRLKPDPLKYISSGNSMGAIAESPTHSFGTAQQLPGQVTHYAGGASIPPTPAAMMQWDAMSTPTGTPLATTQRTTLSLVTMIQSPKAEDGNVMWGSSYHQIYASPPPIGQPQALPTIVSPPQYVATVGAAPSMPASVPATVQYQAVPMPPQAAPPPVQVQPTLAPLGEAACTESARLCAPQASPLAAVKLGLLPGLKPHAAYASRVPAHAQMPMAVMQFSPMVASQPAVSQLSPATFGGSPTPATFGGSPTQQPQRCVPPPPLAPAPTVWGSAPMPATPAGVPATGSMGFTAYATAPTSVAPPAAAPAGGTTGGMPEADLKVLVDMAVASGNQQAIDALLRQAKAGGMSLDKFHSMLSPGIHATGSR